MMKMNKLLDKLLASKLPDDVTLELFMSLYTVGGIYYAKPLLKKILDDSAITKFTWFLSNMYGTQGELSTMSIIYHKYMNKISISKTDKIVRTNVIESIYSRLIDDDLDELNELFVGLINPTKYRPSSS